MIPVNQFILGSSDPLLYPSEKMTNSIDEQIAFLQSQNKKYIGEKYDMNKAHEICERYKEVLPNDVDLAMFMLQLMLNIMIMLNCLKNGLVVI